MFKLPIPLLVFLLTSCGPAQPDLSDQPDLSVQGQPTHEVVQATPQVLP